MTKVPATARVTKFMDIMIKSIKAISLIKRVYNTESINKNKIETKK